MDEALVLAIVGVLVIATAAGLGPRLNVAGPLILVIAGLAVSLLPFVPTVEIDPEIILVVVLPPLLYSAAVSLPAIEFRRDLAPIAGLSVLLVVLSSVVLGLFFAWAIPGLGIFLGIALGAILSPTDAVATSIVKRLGLSRRVVTMLEGESMLNDATSLVLLRTAVAAVAAGGAFAVGDFAWSFLWGVIVAAIIGALVGLLNLRFRAWVGHSAANTAVGFVVPFVAYLPTEQLGGSGLVAAVVAGIVTGQGAARWFTPEQRLSDTLNWRTVELVLEGAVFLVMGLELKEIWRANVADHDGPLRAVWLALAALMIVIVVRAAYVAMLVLVQGRLARGKSRERLDAIGHTLDQIEVGGSLRPPDDEARRGARRGVRGGRDGRRGRKDRAGDAGRAGDPQRRERRLGSMRQRLSRAIADLDYYQASPLGWKHGTVIVWAGMRGVVTLAAAQTLPRDTESRELLILTAFLVAVISLLLQGFTIPLLVRALKLPPENETFSRDEQSRIDAELREAAVAALRDPETRRRDGTAFTPEMLDRVGTRLTEPPDDEETAIARDALELRLALIGAMRERLIEISSGGTFSSAALRHSLAELDADELSLALRLDDEE